MSVIILKRGPLTKWPSKLNLNLGFVIRQMMEHLKMMISGFYTTVSGQTLRQTDKSDN